MSDWLSFHFSSCASLNCGKLSPYWKTKMQRNARLIFLMKASCELNHIAIALTYIYAFAGVGKGNFIEP